MRLKFLWRAALFDSKKKLSRGYAMCMIDLDHTFMREALIEADLAAERGEVPVGAVLVLNGEIIARAHNLVESEQSALAHAEILCVRAGSRFLNNWRLLETTLYCTLEPCPMCAGALIHSRVKRLVWGAPDVRCGAHGSFVNLFDTKHPIHQVEVRGGVLQEVCADKMRAFFKRVRGKKEGDWEFSCS